MLDKLTILNSEIQLSGTALYVIFDPHLIYQFIVSHRMQGSLGIRQRTINRYNSPIMINKIRTLVYQTNG